MIPIQAKDVLSSLSSAKLFEGGEGNIIRNFILDNPKTFEINRLLILIDEWEKYKKTNIIPSDKGELYKITMMFYSALNNALPRMTIMREIVMESYRAVAIIYYNDMLKYQKMHADILTSYKKEVPDTTIKFNTEEVQKALNDVYETAKAAASQNNKKDQPPEKEIKAPPAAKPKNITVIDGGKSIWDKIDEANQKKPKF